MARPSNRFSLKILMAFIAVIAVGLALMKVAPKGSERWAGALFFVVLLIGTLGLFVRRDRAAWVGFALFGWAYAFGALGAPIQTMLENKLPTDEMIDRLVIDHIHLVPPEPTEPLGFIARGNGNDYYKLNDFRQWVVFQPTPSEVKAIDVYMVQAQDYEEMRFKAPRSRQIFYTCVEFAFALVGTIAGQVLSEPAVPLDGSSEPQLSREVG